jgi:tetratricopeptide (TPR) repeat protein
MLVGTYLRWKPVFYLLLAGAAVRTALSIAAIAYGRYYGLICGGAGALFTIVSFFIIFFLEDDFLEDRERILFSIGRKFTGGITLIAQGRSYAKQKMWALAILYFRAGVAKVPDQIAGYLNLASAYTHLERFELAQDTLDKARTIAPQHPRIAELDRLLEQQGPRAGECS